MLQDDRLDSNRGKWEGKLEERKYKKKKTSELNSEKNEQLKAIIQTENSSFLIF